MIDLTTNPIERSRLDPLLRPIQAFLAAESAGGILLMLSSVIAIAWANSAWHESYDHLWHAKVYVGFGDYKHSMSLAHWINDGLMVIFFLLVGLEIKREVLFGELASLKNASLPIAAAIGGMVVPALIYFSFNKGGPGSAGWGIPMATDIAFAVGVLALVGRSLPVSVKIFLLAVAIVDDLGAVLVIALFYTSEISTNWLAAAGALLLVLIILNKLRVHHPLPYLLVGIGLWVATLFSGVHATVAGVLLAFTIPASRQIDEVSYLKYARTMLGQFEKDAQKDPDTITEDQSHSLKALEEASQAVQTPLARVEHALLMPVTLLIIPLFALANAGVNLRGIGAEALQQPITWGIFLGLLLGKPIGVLLAAWAAVRIGVARLPEAVTWPQIFGVSVLCGIGFTMSLFVANLAFPESAESLSASKLGIMGGSLISGIAGALVIYGSARRHAARVNPV